MKFLPNLTEPQTFEAKPITAFIFNLVFSKKTWVILFVLTAFSSFYLNYRLLKAQYVISCGVNGETVARLISKETCGALAETKQDALEVYRLEQVQAMSNEDLFQ